MYAVFVNGGKQYRVKKNQIIQLEKLNNAPGSIIEFNNVLMIAHENKIKVGNPFLHGSKIKAHIENHGRLKKVKIVKFNRRKHYKKQQGHRQYFTSVKILDIDHFNNGE